MRRSNPASSRAPNASSAPRRSPVQRSMSTAGHGAATAAASARRLTITLVYLVRGTTTGAGMFELIVEGAQTRLPVSTRAVAVGRAPANDIVLPDDTVSGRHAAVWADQTGVM